jgi:hypothetical protein
MQEKLLKLLNNGGWGWVDPHPPQKNDPFIMKLDKISMMIKLIGTIYWKKIIYFNAGKTVKNAI